VDADVEIERRAGRSIREVFEGEGEAGFRAREREVMAELLGGGRVVVAAGGGAVLAAETRARMAGCGAVVYLRVTPEVAARRVAADVSTAERRPALTNLPGAAEMEAVIAAREPLYRECATVTLDAGREAAELVEAVLAALPEEIVRGAAT
jgi:shikimate kinase